MQTTNRLIDKSKKPHRGFTLIEMLVVIGIIAILIGATMASFSKMSKTADKTKAQDLVSQAATALAAIYEADGMWPAKIRDANKDKDKGKLDSEIALIIAKRGYMSLSMSGGKLVGRDRFGILTPWAAKVVERKGSSAQESDSVVGGSTIKGSILNFAVDLNGDGVITAEECGSRTGADEIRATAVVWCAGKGDNSTVKSWTKGQEQKVQ